MTAAPTVIVYIDEQGRQYYLRTAGVRLLVIDESDPRGDHMIAGCLVIRLPDLPTPTAGETP